MYFYGIYVRMSLFNLLNATILIGSFYRVLRISIGLEFEYIGIDSLSITLLSLSVCNKTGD